MSEPVHGPLADCNHVYQPDAMPCYKVMQEKTYVLGKTKTTAE